MNKELYAEMVETQYMLPRRFYHYAFLFPHVEFYKALQLYALSVEEIIVMFNAKDLYDEPLSFGRGLVLARKLWLTKMEQAEKIMDRGEDNTSNK